MSSSSKKTSSGTSTQTSTPNNLPYLQKAWTEAEGLLAGNNGTANDALDFLGDAARFAGSSARGGLTTAQGFANGGSANPANRYITPFADGSMTGANNPGFAAVSDKIARQAQASTDGRFAASGRYGSGANANAFNSAVTDTIGQLGYSDYSGSLDRQLQAGGQLSSNESNSVAQALAALGLIPSLGNAATDAGQAGYSAAIAPLTTYAGLLGGLGSGGGTDSRKYSDTSTSSSSMGLGGLLGGLGSLALGVGSLGSSGLLSGLFGSGGGYKYDPMGT